MGQIQYEDEQLAWCSGVYLYKIDILVVTVKAYVNLLINFYVTYLSK